MSRRSTSRHAAPRRPAFRLALPSMKVRALLSLGVLLVVTVPGTLAFWTDTATVQGGTFTAGTLDMTLDGHEGNPTEWTDTLMTLSNMVPGESFASSFTVDNAGSLPFTYTATGAATGSLAPSLTFRAYVGGAASNSTSGGLRAGACDGTATGPAQVLDTSQTVIPGTPPQQVAAGDSETVCVLVSLSTTAPSSAQGASGSASFAVTAKQLGAP